MKNDVSVYLMRGSTTSDYEIEIMITLLLHFPNCFRTTRYLQFFFSVTVYTLKFSCYYRSRFVHRHQFPALPPIVGGTGQAGLSLLR
jgi:hypothetical protein